MSDQDIFDDNDNTGKTDPVVDNVLDVFADKLMAIKKEDGTPKYDSIEKALDALAASQEHIARLEQENGSLRSTSERNKELEEIVKRMTNSNDNEEKPDGNNPPNKGGLSEEKAAELVKRILSEEKQVSAAVQNITNVQNKLVAKFGDKAAEVIQTKAKELGTTAKQLKELSASNPNMVLALFGEASSGSPSVTTSSINTGGIRPPVEELKRPEKSLISGSAATDRNRAEFMKKIKEEVYKKHKVEI